MDWFSAACASLGMTGDCCPSVGGVNLACCSSGVSGSTISGEFQALIYADQACKIDTLPLFGLNCFDSAPLYVF